MLWIFIVLFSATFMNHINCDYGSNCLTPDQQEGLCMPVKSCRNIFELLKNSLQYGGNISSVDRDNLRQLHCGTFKNVPHVCCLQSNIQLNVEGLDVLKNTNCGIYSVDKIANGKKAALFGFPWMVLLKYNDDFINQFKCSGTLISDQYVLTAAHCIQNQEETLKEVRLGEYKISSDIDCTNSTRKIQCSPPVEDIPIEELIMHQDYHSIYNDIGLIRLKRKVEFKRHIKPICLPIYDDLRSKEYSEYVISGWGRTEDDTSSDVLLVAVVPSVDRIECQRKLRIYQLRDSLNNGHICAGGRNLVDSCRGDSGGPLGYRDIYNDGPRFIQFGIVAIGVYNCGAVNVPGIYTNVSHYMQWITDNIKRSSRSAPIIASRINLD